MYVGLRGETWLRELVYIYYIYRQTDRQTDKSCSHAVGLYANYYFTTSLSYMLIHSVIK